MDLNYGAEYEEFRQDVQAFCKEYQGVSFKSESTDNQMHDALGGSSTTEKTAKEVTRSEWQKILIEKGFIALQQLPDYYKHLLYIACSASFGIKAGKGAMGLIKKK